MLSYEIGFSQVIRELIKHRKPFVGHNMFLDMLFIYSQFIDELPDTLQEFREKWLECFPNCYDTKCMATCLSLFTKTDLNSMS